MSTGDYRDIFGGAALTVIGGFATIHAFTSLSMGTLRQMGPGMFPAALGCILIVLGLAILVIALFRPGEKPAADIRPLAAILASIFAFAILVRPFGLVPAILALALIASRADGTLSPRGTAAVAAGLALGAVLVFRVGLGVPVTAIAWPW